MREPEFIDMEVAFRINLYRGQNEVIEVKNSNRDLDDLNKDHNDLKDDLETRLSELKGKVICEGYNQKGKWILTDKMK